MARAIRHISNSNRGGFTILESMIAILLLLILVAGGLAYYSKANALYFIGLNKRLAASLASSKLEICKSSGYSLAGCALEPGPGTDILVGDCAGKRTTSVDILPAIDGVIYKRVTVTVDWIDPNRGSQSITLQTYVGP